MGTLHHVRGEREHGHLTTDVRSTVVAVNTAIAAAFGAVIAMFYAMKRLGKPDPCMMMNGMLEAMMFLERKGVDDPVGAVAVHGFNGIFGVLCVGIFADGRYGAAWNLTDTSATSGKGVTGILDDFGALGFGQLASQAIGALTIILVMGGLAFGFFKVQSRFFKDKTIRSTEADEVAGLDRGEMGVLAYDNRQIREIDVVGLDPSQDKVLATGGESPDPSLGR